MIALYEGYDNFNDTSSITPMSIIFSLIFIVWIVTGILAFITSLFCFFFNGTISDKFLGLIIALIIGPFYWLYFIFNNTGYCSRNQQNVF